MHWYPDMMGWGGVIGMVIFWIVIIIIIVVLVKYIATQSSTRIERNETPLEIIKRRYANGEIDKEEYEQKKKDLET